MSSARSSECAGGASHGSETKKGLAAAVRALALVAVLTAATSGCAPVKAAPPPDHVTIVFRYSRFEPGVVAVPAGVPVTFTLRNDDPIDHEWIVGSPAVHARHRVGTEPVHDERPTEVTVPALSTRETTVTFERAGTLAFVCHLPGHEAYGMHGTVRVLAG